MEFRNLRKRVYDNALEPKLKIMREEEERQLYRGAVDTANSLIEYAVKAEITDVPVEIFQSLIRMKGCLRQKEMPERIREKERFREVRQEYASEIDKLEWVWNV